MNGRIRKKDDRRVRFTKMILRDALISLMKKKSVGEITPTELCRVADINRNTFYAHYGNIVDLLGEIEAELYRDIMSCVTFYPESPLRMKDICAAIKKNGDLCSVILSDFGDRDFLVRIINSVHDLTISDWKKKAPRLSESELENYFVYCTNGSVGVMRRWVLEGMALPVDEVANILKNANDSILLALSDVKKEK